ncbi:MAG: PH domain-containing protein [Clostridia bacterium]|nr:PH domain-containing protein [Clostridia bacterium]
MSNYFENNLNEGERIEIEIKHNRLFIAQEFIKFVIWLAVAITLHILGNLLVDWLCGLMSDVSGLDGLAKAIPIVLYVVVWGGFAFLGIILRVASIMSVYGTKLAITNRRIIGKSGVFSSYSLDYPIEKIDSVSVNTPFFGKIFHYADIEIKSTNAETAITFEGVTNANEFRNALTAAIAKNADEARKAQANEIANAMKGAH